MKKKLGVPKVFLQFSACLAAICLRMNLAEVALGGKGNPDLRGFFRYLDLTEPSWLPKSYWGFSKLFLCHIKLIVLNFLRVLNNGING